MNWGTLGAKSTTMSDDVPLRLPRYVFRRSNGSFRYKRNVPERLRPLIGKATLYRQLGDSYREAMQALPLVHARIEALLNDEADKSARERSLEIIRGQGCEAVCLLRRRHPELQRHRVPQHSQVVHHPV